METAIQPGALGHDIPIIKDTAFDGYVTVDRTYNRSGYSSSVSN